MIQWQINQLQEPSKALVKFQMSLVTQTREMSLLLVSRAADDLRRVSTLDTTSILSIKSSLKPNRVSSMSGR